MQILAGDFERLGIVVLEHCNKLIVKLCAQINQGTARFDQRAQFACFRIIGLPDSELGMAFEDEFC